MSILRKLEPRKGAIDARRNMPLTHSMEEFLEDFPPRRWMEAFEPLGWKWTVKASTTNLNKESSKSRFPRSGWRKDTQ